MPEEISNRFHRIHSLLLAERTSQVRRDSTALNAELHALEQEHLDALRQATSHARDIEELKEKLEKLGQPPLLHALVIGPSPRREGTFVVSVGGQRLDVGVAPPAAGGFDPGELAEGREVLVTRDNHVIVGLVGEARRGDAAEVVEALKDPATGNADRLLVRWGSSEGVVEMSERLLRLPAEAEPPEPRRPRPGDQVLVDLAARMAFESLPPHRASDLELERDPRDRYEDIAGLEDKVELIRDAIELPYLHRRQFESYDLQRPRGILLHGPPGCGKTMIGRAVANGLKTRITQQIQELLEQLDLYVALGRGDPDEATRERLRRACPAAAEAADRDGAVRTLAETLARDWPPDLRLDLAHPARTSERLRAVQGEIRSYFLNIKGPELLSKWVGEAEGRVRQIFSQARDKASYITPVVIFFDEIESMFQRRGSGISTDLEKTMVPALLTELDGIDTLDNVVLIGASNRHELLDPALMRPGRLDIKIRIDRPDRTAAAAVFAKYLTPDLPLSAEGLREVSWTEFDGAVLQSLEALLAAESYLCLGPPGAEPRLVPLRRALPPETWPDIARAARESQPGTGDLGEGDRRLRLADLGRAIEAVYRTHRDRVPPGRPARGAEELRVVMGLGSAGETRIEEGLPRFPHAFAELASGREPSKERLCQRMVDAAVDVLFSATSCLSARVLAGCGTQHTFLLREFVSGALISNVVTRAKRLALKRETASASAGGAGIRLEDLMTALRTEYTENKEQFLLNRPELAERACETCKRRHASADEYGVEIRLGRSSQNRWQRPRRRPHERGRTQAAGRGGPRSPA